MKNLRTVLVISALFGTAALGACSSESTQSSEETLDPQSAVAEQSVEDACDLVTEQVVTLNQLNHEKNYEALYAGLDDVTAQVLNPEVATLWIQYADVWRQMTQINEELVAANEGLKSSTPDEDASLDEQLDNVDEAMDSASNALGQVGTITELGKEMMDIWEELMVVCGYSS